MRKIPRRKGSVATRHTKKDARKAVRLHLPPHVIAYFKSKDRHWHLLIDRALSAIVKAAE